MPKWFLVTFAVVAFLGFLDATYLTVEHYLGVVPPCYAADGCEQVLTSDYAVIGSIPISLFGLLYYLSIIIVLVFFWDTGYMKSLWALVILPIGGLVATAWFVYLQLFVIKAICFYCMVSATLSVILFIGSLFILKLLRNNK